MAVIVYHLRHYLRCMLFGVMVLSVFFFFFKQKTAYEMLRSLVGSEMCIRDRARTIRIPVHMVESINKVHRIQRQMMQELEREPTTVSYTHLTLPTIYSV